MRVHATGTVRHKADVQSRSQREKLFSDMSRAPFAVANTRADEAQLFAIPHVLWSDGRSTHSRSIGHSASDKKADPPPPPSVLHSSGGHRPLQRAGGPSSALPHAPSPSPSPTSRPRRGLRVGHRRRRRGRQRLGSGGTNVHLHCECDGLTPRRTSTHCTVHWGGGLSTSGGGGGQCSPLARPPTAQLAQLTPPPPTKNPREKMKMGFLELARRGGSEKSSFAIHSVKLFSTISNAQKDPRRQNS